MSDFKDEIIKFLTNGQGFIMESFLSESRNTLMWLAIKSKPEGDYVILITNDFDEKVDTLEALNYLNRKRRHYNLHKIVLSKNGAFDNTDSISKCVVDMRYKTVVYCDPRSEVLSRIVRAVANSNGNYRTQPNTNIPRKSGINAMVADKTMHVTLILIAINVLMYLISAFMAKNILDIDVYTLVKLGGKVGAYVDAGQYWRLLTCMFLHGGLIHLVFNMYALFVLGPQIERLFGRVKFIIIYFASGLSSSLFSYIFGPKWVVSNGASGAIFGLLGALLVFALKEKNRVNRNVLNNLIFIVILNLVIGFSSNSIDNLGHIGGLVLGAVLSYVFLVTKKRAY